MKEVYLKKGWIYRIERFFYSHKEEAQDTCTLRWRLIKIIMSIPSFFMTWVYLRWTEFMEKWEDAAPWSIGLKAFSLFLVSAITYKEMTNDNGNFIYSQETTVWVFIGVLLFSSLIIAIAIGIILLAISPIFFLIKFFYNNYDKINNKLPNKQYNVIKKQYSVIKELYQSAKEKYCAKIKWYE